MNIAGMDTGYIYGKHFNRRGINSRITGGFLLKSSLDTRDALTLTAAFYYQLGRDRDAQRLNAYTSAISLSYAGRQWTYGCGWDYLSGNDAFSSSSANHRFDPLYGTPHKFWGSMDYFYVATGSPTGGLGSPYATIRYAAAEERLRVELDCHYFSLARDQKDIAGAAVRKYLGSEVDMRTFYALNRITDLEYGFGVMAATGTMELPDDHDQAGSFNQT